MNVNDGACKDCRAEWDAVHLAPSTRAIRKRPAPHPGPRCRSHWRFLVQEEAWRLIPGWPDYEVSSQGRVRSLNRFITDSLGRRRIQRGVLKRTQIDSGGYRRVELAAGGRRLGVGVHRLVALAFIGPQPDCHEVRHLNGRPADNRVENLAWGTHAENVADTRTHGTWRHANAEKEVCPEGHAYSGRNARGERVCRPCRRRQQAEYRHRQSAL